MASFSRDISKFVKITGLRGDTVLRKLGLDGYAGLMKRSPVLEGRFRGSWRIGVNSIDNSIAAVPAAAPEGEQQVGGRKFHPATASELADAEQKISVSKFGDTIHLTNSVKYAKALEGGSSRQARNGIVGPTFQELKSNFAATVRAVKQSVK